jgi:TolB protein
MADTPERPVGPPAVADAASRRPGTRRATARAVVVVVAGVGPGGAIAWLARGTTGPIKPASGGPARIALVTPDGGLAVEDTSGHRTVLAAPPGTAFGFPAWSPDGGRVAAVDNGPDGAAIAIFAAPAGDQIAGSPPAPLVVYRSAAVPPFYLYWAPDGTRVSFLATESDGISLRVAPADASAPLDGSEPGGIVRRGAPLYFTWIDDAHLLVHVGSGSSGYLGELGPDGAAAGPELDDPGDFRSAVISADRRTIAWVRGTVPSAAVVVAARDGSAQHAVPVFGPAAAVFDPAGDDVAIIGADQAGGEPFAFPLGPLRLVDAATGAVRTLLDGRVVGFFWAPDGKTIAALRVENADGSTEARLPVRLAALGPTPTPSGAIEIHLLFVDVASGAIRSDRTVRLTSHFLNQFLPYFDQYALSHRLWAPDSSSILLPLVDATGQAGLAVLPREGGAAARTIDGVSGFWSP